ncbi:unnamed protein product [Effrenium voratum]|nr:unnamed protein product [Effrenium voratum]
MAMEPRAVGLMRAASPEGYRQMSPASMCVPVLQPSLLRSSMQPQQSASMLLSPGRGVIVTPRVQMTPRTHVGPYVQAPVLRLGRPDIQPPVPLRAHSPGRPQLTSPRQSLGLSPRPLRSPEKSEESLAQQLKALQEAKSSARAQLAQSEQAIAARQEQLRRETWKALKVSGRCFAPSPFSEVNFSQGETLDMGSPFSVLRTEPEEELPGDSTLSSHAHLPPPEETPREPRLSSAPREAEAREAPQAAPRPREPVREVREELAHERRGAKAAAGESSDRESGRL